MTNFWITGKRTAKIADDSGKSIEITIWGGQAEKFPEEDAQVVAFKGARVTEWNEKSLGTNSGTSFEVNPDQEAATRLKEWFENGGAASTQSLSVSMGGNTADRDAARAALADLQVRGNPPRQVGGRWWVGQEPAGTCQD